MLRRKLVVTRALSSVNRWGQDSWTGRYEWRSTTDLIYTCNLVIYSLFFLFASGCTTSKHTVLGGALTVLEERWKDSLDQVAITASFTKAVGLAGEISQTIKLLWLKFRSAKPNSPALALMSRHRGKGWDLSAPRSPPRRQEKVRTSRTCFSWWCHQGDVQPGKRRRLSPHWAQ